MKEHNTTGHIHSLDGKVHEITIITEEKLFGHVIPNSYIVKYNDVLCTAFYNSYVNAFYVDDVYGKVTSYER